MEKTKSKRGEIAAILRKMKIGETVFFSLEKYNLNSVRSAPASTLHKEYAQGWRWSTRFDPFGNRLAVTRIL